MPTYIRRVLSLLILCGLMLVLAPRTAALTSSVSFTLTVKSAFARAAPSLSAAPVASLFKGQTYTISARSTDGRWLRLDYAGAANAWVLKAYGTVSGNPESLPIATDASTAGVAPSPTATAPANPAYYAPTDLPILPTVSQTARAIYQRGLQLGNNPQAFSKVGDCLSVTPYFLAAFDAGDYALGPYSALQPAVDYFAGSFGRQSLAAGIGFSPANVMVSIWADPKRCLKKESPLGCELRLHRPSFVFVSLGTNGAWLSTAQYETSMRQILDVVIARGAVPILATKPDDLEGAGRFNRVTVTLAQEYDVPLWNFWRATQALPDRGLNADGFHLSWDRDYFDDPLRLQKGYPLRNLTALQALDAVWRGVTAP